MKVSIITTIYKAEKDLPRLLDSMMAQDSPELEFFLIDNGSPDRCGEICKEYALKDSRFVVRTLEENIGYIRARNLGVQEVDADYVGFCDSDDYLEPHGYDLAIKKIKECDCDLYIGNYNTIDGTKAQKNALPYLGDIYYGEQIQAVILPQAFGPLLDRLVLHGFAWKQIFRRKVFIEKELFFIPKLQPYEDQVLNIDFIRHSRCICVDDNILYNYVVSPKSITARNAKEFDAELEWNRIVVFYHEKKSRVMYEIEETALSNLMYNFLYSFFLNGAKNSQTNFWDLKSVLQDEVVDEMLQAKENATNLLDAVAIFCLKHHFYRFLFRSMKIMLMFRG